MSATFRSHVGGLLFALLGLCVYNSILAVCFVLILEIGYLCGAFEVAAKTRKAWMLALGTFLIVYCVLMPVPLISRAHLINLALLGGWTRFLYRVIPAMTWEPKMCLLGVFASIAFLGGVEMMGRAFVNRPATGDAPARAWRFRWSAGIVAVVAILFFAGLATVGILSSAKLVWELRQ